MSVERVTFSCLVDGQICQNVIHFTNPDGTMTGAQIADEVDTHWLQNIRPFQHTGAVWFDIEVRQVSPVGLAAFHKTITQAGTGPAESTNDNPVISRVLQFQTAVAGRHGRGRYYIPGVSFQGWDKGIVKPTSITTGVPLVNNLKARFVNPGHPSPLTLVLSQRSAPASVIDVSNIVQRTVLGYQRKRSIGVGI